MQAIAIAAAVTRTPNKVQLLMCVMPRCHVNTAVSICIAVPKLSARKNTQQKLTKQKPRSIGQAARIPGVSPGDVAALMIYLEKYRREHREDSPCAN